MISNLAPLPGSFDHLIDLVLFSLGFFLKPLSDTKFFSCLSRYMPSSTRSNKKTQLLLSSDPASLERSICKGIRSSLQRNTFLIDRQQHLFVARFSSATVDPDTSLVDRHSLTTIDRRHSSFVDQHLPSDVDRYFSPNIDRY